MTRAIIIASFAAALLAPAPVEAHGPARAPRFIWPAPRGSLITQAYAKRLVSQKATQLAGHRWGKGWKVDLRGVPEAPVRGFTARVNWGRGPHIMIATPAYAGRVDMRKGAGAPAGLARVRAWSDPRIAPFGTPRAPRPR